MEITHFETFSEGRRTKSRFHVLIEVVANQPQLLVLCHLTIRPIGFKYFLVHSIFWYQFNLYKLYEIFLECKVQWTKLHWLASLVTEKPYSFLHSLTTCKLSSVLKTGLGISFHFGPLRFNCIRKFPFDFQPLQIAFAFRQFCSSVRVTGLGSISIS